jgi:seryl-tRNA(Sec) selenium transferase
MKSYAATGADLVCFSAKYCGGPNAGGFICGRRDLIEAVAGLDFTQFESGQYRVFGRAFKLDRQIIVGVLVAFQEWVTQDHNARWAGYQSKAYTIARRLEGISGITVTPRYFTMDERLVAEPVNCLAIDFLSGTERTAKSISAALIAGDPSVATVVLGKTLVVATDTVCDGQELIIAERLNCILGAMAAEALTVGECSSK